MMIVPPCGRPTTVTGTQNTVDTTGLGNRRATSAILLAVFLLLSIVLLTAASDDAVIDRESTLSCHRRQYTYKVTTRDDSGRQCWDHVNVMSCWGRCDSNEIADWRFPYKRSHHPVCLHESTRRNSITLRHCDAGVTPGTELYEFTEASVCSCSLCRSSQASCEGLRYRGVRRSPRDTTSQLLKEGGPPEGSQEQVLMMRRAGGEAAEESMSGYEGGESLSGAEVFEDSVSVVGATGEGGAKVPTAVHQLKRSGGVSSGRSLFNLLSRYENIVGERSTDHPLYGEGSMRPLIDVNKRKRYYDTGRGAGEKGEFV